MPSHIKPGRRKRRQRELLAFLCERNVGRSIRAAISSLQGFSAADVGRRLLSHTTGDPTLLALATRENRVLLARDTDFLDLVKYPPGTHSGVVVLQVEPANLDREIDMLLWFLRTNYKQCHSNTVEIRFSEVRVNVAKRPREILRRQDD